jgi:hypothetical protein
MVSCVQPIVTLVGKKCKRCGLYEKDAVKSDDTFDQWELCPLDFSPSPEGLYSRLKEKEFNLTLSCPNCSKHNRPYIFLFFLLLPWLVWRACLQSLFKSARRGRLASDLWAFLFLYPKVKIIEFYF